MGEFFGSIYCCFEDFFGLDLAEYMWGISSPLSDKNLFIGIGIWTIVISLFVVVLYYYIIDHPRLNKWWCWSLFLGSNACFNFIVGWQYVLADFYEGKMVMLNPATGLQSALNIGESDIVCFGVANLIISVIVFFVVSMMFKWWSRHCSHSPF